MAKKIPMWQQESWEWENTDIDRLMLKGCNGDRTPGDPLDPEFRAILHDLYNRNRYVKFYCDWKLKKKRKEHIEKHNALCKKHKEGIRWTEKKYLAAKPVTLDTIFDDYKTIYFCMVYLREEEHARKDAEKVEQERKEKENAD